MRADLERVQAENQDLARVMDVVNAPRLRLIALGGQPASPTSEGRVLWSPESRKAVFYASKPAGAAGRQGLPAVGDRGLDAEERGRVPGRRQGRRDRTCCPRSPIPRA